jgi:hypothetical protein
MFEHNVTRNWAAEEHALTHLFKLVTADFVYLSSWMISSDEGTVYISLLVFTRS